MTAYRFGTKVRELSRRICSGLAGALEPLLPSTWIEDGLTQVGYRSQAKDFTPCLVLWSFVGQALSPDTSCRSALARIQEARASAGQHILSSHTGGYCRARSRLPTDLLWTLFSKTGTTLSERATEPQLWHGLRVKVIDGSTCSMADTPENQAAFPQSSTQTAGCGFPTAKFLAGFCLSTGAAIELVIGNLHDSEIKMLRSLPGHFGEGDLLLADRGFCSFSDMADLLRHDAAYVIRSKRQADFRRGKRLGKNDHIVTWRKPRQRPPVMSADEFERLPASIQVRELRFKVSSRGHRPKDVVIATSLLDEKRYPYQDLVELYRQRWEVETFLGQTKTSLSLETVRGRTPEMVRKEILVYFIAYNLVKTLIWEAAEKCGLNPRRLSFKGAVQHVMAIGWTPTSALPSGGANRREVLLCLISLEVVPDRPGRREPRAVKRRPKQYSRLRKPRGTMRKLPDLDRRK